MRDVCTGNEALALASQHDSLDGGILLDIIEASRQSSADSRREGVDRRIIQSDHSNTIGLGCDGCKSSCLGRINLLYNGVSTILGR